MHAAAAPQNVPRDGPNVFLPLTYILRRRHVEAALEELTADVDNVTLLVHSATLGIERECFVGLATLGMSQVSRVAVWGERSYDDVGTAALGMIIAKLRAYEPDVVDRIHGFVTHNGSSELRRVGEHAFLGMVRTIQSMARNHLREVVLPPSITHLDGGAFYQCASLSSIVLPSELTHVGEFAFMECRALTSVKLPNTVTHVGNSAFSGCFGLESLDLGDSLAHIGTYAFNHCSKLSEVRLPNSLTHIGDYAFRKCFSLQHVTMPAVRPFVGRDVFNKCGWRDDGAEAEPMPSPSQLDPELVFDDWD